MSKVNQLKLYLVTIFTVSLLGCSWLDKDRLQSVEPSASFTVSVSTGTVPLRVSFTDTSTPGSEPITNWFWEFGDGATSNSQNPTYEYVTPGQFTVRLTVTTEVGISVFSLASPINVQAIPPQASFSLDNNNGDAPFVVTFQDTSIAGTGQITRWRWDFGDGATSTEQNPVHTYTQEGIYSVRLTVTAENNFGEDSFLLEDAVEVTSAQVEAFFTIQDITGKLVTDVTPESENATIVSYEVNEFGQLIVQLVPQDESAVIRLSKTGYSDSIAFVELPRINSYQQVTMLKMPATFTVDPNVGGVFRTGDGAKLTLPAMALNDIEGNLISETLELFISTVDISDPIATNAFPGSFIGRPLNFNDDVDIASYGVVEMTFLQNGEVITVVPNTNIGIEIPLYANLHLGGATVNPFDQIPFWILNEETGIWEHQSNGEVVNSANSPTGLALSALTNHFSWFNADAWAAPGAAPLGRGQLPTGNQIDNWCRVSVTLVGPEVGDAIEMAFSRSRAGWPTNTIKQRIVYQGQPIRSALPVGTIYGVSAFDKDLNRAADRVGCGSPQDIDIVLTLPDEGQPQFGNFQAFIDPVFEVVDGQHTINKNAIIIGGEFSGDDDNSVSITSNFFTGTLELPYLAVDNLEVEQQEGPEFELVATLRNPQGESSESFSLNYVASQTPVVDDVQAYPEYNSPDININWSQRGADTLNVYYQPNETIDLGVQLKQIDVLNDPQVEMITLSQGQSDQSGYLQFEFINQYGATIIYFSLSDFTCFDGCF